MDPIRRMTERKEHISNARPERFVLVQRAAQTLGRRNVDQATVELLAEAAMGATALAFERDEDGALINMDPATGRVLFALPWGRSGYKAWGLTPSEGRALRAIVQDRQTGGALWLYDKSRRMWFVNRTHYRTYADALAYWERRPLAVKELRKARTHLVARRVGRNVGR